MKHKKHVVTALIASILLITTLISGALILRIVTFTSGPKEDMNFEVPISTTVDQSNNIAVGEPNPSAPLEELPISYTSEREKPSILGNYTSAIFNAKFIYNTDLGAYSSKSEKLTLSNGDLFCLSETLTFDKLKEFQVKFTKGYQECHGAFGYDSLLSEETITSKDDIAFSLYTTRPMENSSRVTLIAKSSGLDNELISLSIGSESSDIIMRGKEYIKEIINSLEYFELD